MENKLPNTTEAWEPLKAFTDARIALGRAGTSIPLKESLSFKLAHAHARDAVYSLMNNEVLVTGIKNLGMPVLALCSKANTRQQYLQRPDLGRQPDDRALETINDHVGDYDICIIVADGLSANAVNNNALPVIAALLPLLQSVKYCLSPICLAAQARVAFADPVAHGLKAKLSVIFIGERPGLSSPDSMGAYITYNPRPGLTDECRNCVSNIRHHGMTFAETANKIFYLIREAFKRKLSGIHLKDNAGLLE